MDLNSFSAKSADLVLADVDPKFKRFEGDLERAKRVSVVIKTVTSEDKMHRSALFAKKETKYIGGDSEAKIAAIADVVVDDVDRRKMLECYWLLESVANLERGGVAVFQTMPVRDLKQAEFEKIWGKLPPELTAAIHLAVMQHNPIWDPERQGE